MSRVPRRRRSTRIRRGGTDTGSSTLAPPRASVLAPLLALVLTLGTVVGVPSLAHADAGSRNEAIAQALAQSGGGGKVLGVKEERDARGGVVYAVKVLTDGRVRVVRIRGR